MSTKSTRKPALVTKLALSAMLVMGASTAASAADSLGATGLIDNIRYVGDSSSYSGNFRTLVSVGSDNYFNGSEHGFCGAYAEFGTDVIALLQQMQINGVVITPRYKIGTYSKRCLVGWN